MLPTLNGFLQKINKQPQTYMAYIVSTITETCEWIQRIQYEKLQKKQALKNYPKQNWSPFYFGNLLVFRTIWLHTLLKQFYEKNIQNNILHCKVFNWLRQSKTGLKVWTLSCIIRPAKKFLQFLKCRGNWNSWKCKVIFRIFCSFWKQFL